MRELRTWDASSDASDDFNLKRRQLFASRENILQCANFPAHVKVNYKILSEFLGEGTVLVVDEVDCAAAKKQHEEWFTIRQELHMMDKNVA